jgi:hypothetical protein
LRPSTAGARWPDAASASDVLDAGRSATTQWMNPFAVGSSTIRRKAAVPYGAPAQARGGETSGPSQV